jgi:hypothetical protein
VAAAVRAEADQLMGDLRNQRRLQKKIQRGLLAPYRAIAARTKDSEAATAILGLVGMVEHAMNEFGAFEVPVGSPDFALLEALADAGSVEEMERIAQRERERYEYENDEDQIKSDDYLT